LGEKICLSQKRGGNERVVESGGGGSAKGGGFHRRPGLADERGNLGADEAKEQGIKSGLERTNLCKILGKERIPRRETLRKPSGPRKKRTSARKTSRKEGKQT